MSSLVIVAIPREDDIVWKISSEKVPHLTLMYLGEVEDANHAGRMAEFVQHALNINEHGPFYLEVDRRGELGPDKADVLFFENGWDSKWIKSLRGQLLKQNDIRTAFEAQDQFPDWVPHLTLGYPDTPAKPVPDDRRLYSVEFDRIAVWTGDYEGPEFRLKWPERAMDDECAVAYSDIGKSTVEELLHFGVKGMRWGQRKDDSGGGAPKSVIEKPKSNLTKNQRLGYVGAGVAGAALTPGPLMGFGVLGGLYVAEAANKPLREGLKKDRAQNQDYAKDKKWEKEFKKDKKYVDVHNDVADHMNSWLPGYNKKYDGVDLTKNPTKMKEYEDGYFKENASSFARSYSKIYGSSPSGKYKVSVIPGTDRVVLHNALADPSSFKHAAEADEPLMTFRLTQDPKTWHILKVEPVTESIAQTMEMGAEFLEHYGVKGMKWGQRKEDRPAETKKGMFDPEGHDKTTDIVKSVVWPMVPPLGVFAIPAQVRMTVAATRGAKAYLEHRKTPEQREKRAKAKLARRDFYWEQHTYNDGLHADVHNKVADEIDHKVTQLGSAPKYRGKNLKADKALKDEYDQDVAKVTDAAYKRAVNDVYGVNPSGTKRAHFVEDARGQRIEVRDNAGKTLYERSLTSKAELQRREEQARLDDVMNELGHAADEEQFDGPDIFITVKEDDNGFIVSMGRVKIPEDDEENMIHSMELGEEFILEHFGIKGMRWGRRKEPPTAVAPTATSHVPHGEKRKTKIEVEGGENHPAHEDAIKVAQAQAKLKKSGTKALSNKELQEVANRIQLEERVSLLTASSGRKFVRKHLTNQSDALARAGLQEAIKTGPTAAKRARRGAVTVGRIAAMPV